MIFLHAILIFEVVFLDAVGQVKKSYIIAVFHFKEQVHVAQILVRAWPFIDGKGGPHAHA